MYQNYCTNCGMCPFSGNNGAATTTIRPPEGMSNNPVNTNPASATSNFQLATWFQTQNFYQFHQQQQNNDESGPFFSLSLSLIDIHIQGMKDGFYENFGLMKNCHSKS